MRRRQKMAFSGEFASRLLILLQLESIQRHVFSSPGLCAAHLFAHATQFPPEKNVRTLLTEGSVERRLKKRQDGHHHYAIKALLLFYTITLATPLLVSARISRQQNMLHILFPTVFPKKIIILWSRSWKLVKTLVGFYGWEWTFNLQFGITISHVLTTSHWSVFFGNWLEMTGGMPSRAFPIFRIGRLPKPLFIPYTNIYKQSVYLCRINHNIHENKRNL